jgi:hypothetical protein
MHKSATKCNKTQGKWFKNKHGVSKIIDTFETYHLSLPPYLFLSPKNNDTPAQTRVLAALHLDFFDLLAQPIIVAEIWSICSPVCDSSDCPSRILFSRVFLEYFISIGDR